MMELKSDAVSNTIIGSMVTGVLGLIGIFFAGWLKRGLTKLSIKTSERQTADQVVLAGLKAQIEGWESFAATLQGRINQLVVEIEKGNQTCDRRIRELEDYWKQRESSLTAEISALRERIRRQESRSC